MTDVPLTPARPGYPCHRLRSETHGYWVFGQAAERVRGKLRHIEIWPLLGLAAAV